MRRHVDPEVLAEALEVGLDKADPVAEALDEYLREESDEIKLLALSRLMQYLGGHRGECDGNECPMDDPMLDAASHAVHMIFDRFHLSHRQVHFIVSGLIGGLGLRLIDKRLSRELNDGG